MFSAYCGTAFFIVSRHTAEAADFSVTITKDNEHLDVDVYVRESQTASSYNQRVFVSECRGSDNLQGAVLSSLQLLKWPRCSVSL